MSGTFQMSSKILMLHSLLKRSISLLPELIKKIDYAKRYDHKTSKQTKIQL